jgi:hypothetical protein
MPTLRRTVTHKELTRFACRFSCRSEGRRRGHFPRLHAVFPTVGFHEPDLQKLRYFAGRKKTRLIKRESSPVDGERPARSGRM